jgi:hypothetical protein
MKKIIFTIITLFSFSSLNASYLLGNLEKCAEDYYYSYDSGTSTYKLYYLNSRTNNWNSTTTNVGFIDDGYVYDSNTSICSLSPIPQKLGIQYHEYKFLMGLMGLLVGFAWLVPFLNTFSRR